MGQIDFSPGASMAEIGIIRLEGSFAEESGRLPADGLDDRVHLLAAVPFWNGKRQCGAVTV